RPPPCPPFIISLDPSRGAAHIALATFPITDRGHRGRKKEPTTTIFTHRRSPLLFHQGEEERRTFASAASPSHQTTTTRSPLPAPSPPFDHLLVVGHHRGGKTSFGPAPSTTTDREPITIHAGSLPSSCTVATTARFFTVVSITTTR
ncbi:hypothetical protein Dimus_013705, partial [Dionaea muscipula]